MVSLLVCPALHMYIRYPMNKEKKILKLLQVDAVESPQFSFFVGQGDMQHAGYGRMIIWLAVSHRFESSDL